VINKLFLFKLCLYFLQDDPTLYTLKSIIYKSKGLKRLSDLIVSVFRISSSSVALAPRRINRYFLLSSQTNQEVLIEGSLSFMGYKFPIHTPEYFLNLKRLSGQSKLKSLLITK